MNKAMYEDYFKEKIWMHEAVMLLMLFSLFTGFTFAGRADAEDAKNIVAAKVNGVVITNDSVIKVMKNMLENKERKERPEELRNKALNSLIIQELAWQKAKAEGLTVEQKTIDEAIEKTKTSYGGESGFSAFLEQVSLTEEGLREILVKSYTLKLIIAREVSEKVTVTEDELKQEYEKEKEKHRKPEKVSVLDVVFFLKMDDADSIRKAEGVLKKIHDAEEKNPLKLVPDGTFLVRDIDLKKEEEPELYEEAKKLKADELSGVIRTSDSYHIIKLKEYIPERQKTLDEVRRNIDVKLIAEARSKRLKEFESELKKGAKIEIMDAKGSE